MKRLLLSDDQKDDLLHHPAAAITFFLGYDLPPAQLKRIEAMWTTPFVLDDSGRSTGKSANAIMVGALKAILIDNWIELLLALAFGSGKELFDKYIDHWIRTNPRFRSQVRGKRQNWKQAAIHDADIWEVGFVNGSCFRIIPPSISREGRRTKSQRCNGLILNEWTSFPDQSIFERIFEPMATNANPKYAETLDPVYTNHIIYDGSADWRHSPAHNRVEKYDKQVAKGDPDYVHINLSYRDLPGYEYIIWSPKIIKNAQCMLPSTEFRMVWLGEWQDLSGRVYDPVLVKRIRRAEVGVELFGDPAYDYVMGVDVARSAGGKGDDFAVGVRKLKDGGPDEIVHFRRQNDISADEMAVIIQDLVERFPTIVLLVMDLGGGGVYVADSLKKTELETEGGTKHVAPIINIDDETSVEYSEGRPILCYFSRGSRLIKEAFEPMKGDDVLINRAHIILQGEIEHELLVAPRVEEGIDIAREEPEALGMTQGEFEALRDIENAFCCV